MSNTLLPDASSPLLRALLEFNLLPSRTLHRERADALWPEDREHAPLLALGGVKKALHRQRSQQLLASLGAHADPILSLEHVELPLALAKPKLLTQLMQRAGAMLLGGTLRQTIERPKVMQAREALGESLLSWVLDEAADCHAGLEDSQLRCWSQADLNATALTLGSGLVALAWKEAPAGLLLRANWKLPFCAEQPDLQATSGLSPRAARGLCLKLLQQLDSTWLSYFPATR